MLTPAQQSQLDRIEAMLTAIRPAAPIKAQYTIREAAPMLSLSLAALKRRSVLKRYGAIKRGGRWMFPASALTAISTGQKL